ncbi:MAG: bifunctional isocitrate dehydrogenase kinase/phosphatase [Pseudomonadales bacterium]
MPTSRKLARAVLNGFHSMFADFQNITLAAKARFEQADWHGIQQAQADRLEIYKSKVKQLIPLMETLSSNEIDDLDLWCDIKAHYIQLISQHANYEIAETFFNSVFCKVIGHEHIDDRHAFVLSSQMDIPENAEFPVFTSYPLEGSTKTLIARILHDYQFSIPYEDLKRDTRNVVKTMIEEVSENFATTGYDIVVDVLEPVFYRNKSAYIVARIKGFTEQPLPFVLPILHNDKNELYVDTVITDPDEIGIIFSFTRSYFMVDAPQPSQIVKFLAGLMPHKKIYELYASIGFRKHSKSEFFRDFVFHLQSSDDQFVLAPGIKGMVMSVFTLPSYDIVFKIIKDKFAPPKEVTRAIVKEKYQLVTKHDRAGRMADTQEFSGFHFPKERFSEELLEELTLVAPSLLTITETDVIIAHLYTERRMVPLNLYLKNASDEEIVQAMDEYGNSIRQLAAANIFAGDMLLKNFGVTRHGRVVFYDYDEICFLTECNFRTIPKAKTEEQEMASQPWYTVAEFDIFPEEFSLFFSGNPKARIAFDRLHGDLYEADTWKQLQQQIEAGKIVNVFPYRRKKRFVRQQQMES